MSVNISQGKIPGAKKILLYGPEGIGKSTFASKFRDPLFIDTEGSTKELDVKRFDRPTKWEDIEEDIVYVSLHPECCKTLIIDTADWAEALCITKTCLDGKVPNIESFGYGKGYVYLQDNFKLMLDALDKLVDMGIDVVVTAHAKMRKFEQPDEMGAYDRWELKLTRQVAPMIKEWADMVLFANYKTFVVEDDKTKSKKAQGGKRVMYTSHHPAWDAKNRYGLEDCLPFDYASIKAVIEGKAKAPKPVKSTETVAEPAAPAPLDPINGEPETVPFIYFELRKLMDAAQITADEVEHACVNKGMQPKDVHVWEYPEEFIQKALIDKWEGFMKHVNKNYKEMPFIDHWADVTKKEEEKNND